MSQQSNHEWLANYEANNETVFQHIQTFGLDFTDEEQNDSSPIEEISHFHRCDGLLPNANFAARKIKTILTKRNCRAPRGFTGNSLAELLIPDSRPKQTGESSTRNYAPTHNSQSPNANKRRMPHSFQHSTPKRRHVDIDGAHQAMQTMPQSQMDKLRPPRGASNNRSENITGQSETSGKIINNTGNNRPNRRGRHFRLNLPIVNYDSIPFKDTLQDICQFATGQEECSETGFRHLELFITTRYNTSIRNVCKKFGVLWASIVETNDISRQIDYCQKLDTRVPNGITISYGKRPQLRDTNEFWTRFLASETIHEGMALLESERPGDYIKYAGKCENTLRRKLGMPTRARFNSNWKTPHKTFQYNNDLGIPEMRTLIFVGLSGIEKTNFALSHFENPLHVTGRQKLDLLGPSKFPYDGVVVDDLNLAEWKLHEVQNIFDCAFKGEIDGKYGASHIASGTPRIICCNSLDCIINPNWPEDKLEALYRRIAIYYFKDSTIYASNKEASGTKIKTAIRYAFQVDN